MSLRANRYIHAARVTGEWGKILPQPMMRKLEQYEHDDESVRQYGVEVCTEICQKLMTRVAGFHFYCLNRVPSSAEVLRNLGWAK